MTVPRGGLSINLAGARERGMEGGDAVMPRLWILPILLAAAGCFGPQRLTEDQKMNSSAGVERAQAVTAAGERMDRAKIPTLINRLEDDDPAVRLAAVNSLRSITGQDFGYVAYDDEATRRVAVAKWREWQQGAVPAQRRPPATTGQTPASRQVPPSRQPPPREQTPSSGKPAGGSTW